MAKKKAAKPAEVAAEPAEAAAEKKGEEVESETAIVEEATITVRGTSVGGTCKMTPSEHKAYCEEQSKAAKEG